MEVQKKRALLSVSDKTGVTELAGVLADCGYELISTGGTAALLKEHGLEVKQIEEITGFPECMDGRLKTLHPRVFGGLLSVRGNSEHLRVMDEQGIGEIDVIVVNLYPFRQTVESLEINQEECAANGKKNEEKLEKIIEKIDIGGPSMIRAAAKNYKYVAVVTNPADYGEFSEKLRENELDEEYRFKLAARAFRYTAAYDAYIAAYLTEQTAVAGEFPDTLTMTFDRLSDMRYGENPHQIAAYYAWANGRAKLGTESAEVLQGKALSFNNIADAYAAMALTMEFDPAEKAVCIAVKHATPCGVALGETVFSAYTAAYECDPQSIYGGIVSFNRELDEQTAKAMAGVFLEVIIAPSYTEKALKVLAKKKNLRVLAVPDMMLGNNQPEHFVKCKNNRKTGLEFKSVGGGMLIQSADSNDIGAEDYTVVTKAAPSSDMYADFVFGMKVVKHVKSNAIVLVKNGVLLGQCGGQVSRVWSAQAAIERAGEKARGAVLASDALLPFADVVEECAKAGVAAIVQTGGSKNDQASIDACDAHGIAMVMTGVRHFKH